MSSILQSRPVAPHTQSQCPQCRVQLEYPAQQPSTSTAPQVRCFQCATVFAPVPMASPPPPPPPPPSQSGSAAAPPRRGRRIGTTDKPLETAYYDVLGVPVDASTDDIKKAYRKLAIKCHPDKNRDDPRAEERFKEIAIAYQTLSDPALRKKYNEFGSKESAPEGGYIDPEEVFGAMFGGDKFVPIIGHLSLARDMKTALQEDDGEETTSTGQKTILGPEEKARKDEKDQKVYAQKAKEREERVAKLVETLQRKLSIFTESATGVNDADVTKSWQTICQLEAEELRHESYGVELLHTIGFVYTSKARHFLATSQSFMGVGGWLHGVQSKYHVFSETVSTVRAALEVKRVFEQLAEAEKAGVTPEQKQKLEEQATEKGIQALFKGAKLEIESILRETCDRVLSPEPPLPRQKLILRATALEMLGSAFSGVRGDGSAVDAEYVRVETKSSKAREGQAGGRG